MQLKNLLTLALGATASAQSLTEALAAANDTLSLLTGLVTGVPGLADSLSEASNITILAPSNAALQAFLNSTAGMAAGGNPETVAALLMYHVLNGTYPSTAVTNATQFLPSLLSNETYTNVTGGQVVGAKSNGSEVSFYSGLLQSSKVVTANVNFTGGVIHIIDTVLTVPDSVPNTASAANLTSLVGALKKANLVDTITGLKDVTIFAPSNDAFGAIASAAGNLSVETLGDILQYHVIQGSVVYSSDIMNGTVVETVGGGNVTITVIDGAVYVNSAKVIVPDVLVANGVVHVIDGVLNPGNSTAAPNPTTTAPAFPGVSSGVPPFQTEAGPPATTISNAPTDVGAPGAPAATSSAGAARAMQTGAIGVGALLGGAMVFAANM